MTSCDQTVCVYRVLITCTTKTLGDRSTVEEAEKRLKGEDEDEKDKEQGISSNHRSEALAEKSSMEEEEEEEKSMDKEDRSSSQAAKPSASSHCKFYQIICEIKLFKDVLYYSIK